MTVGAPSEDGMPEPLQFALDARTSPLLIASDGMEWVIGKGWLVSDGRNECLLSLEVANETDV